LRSVQDCNMRPYTLLLLFVFAVSCKNEYKKPDINANDLAKTNRLLLEVAMEDGFPPPIASRVYVYPHIATYLALMPFSNGQMKDISKSLNGFSQFKMPDTTGVDGNLSALLTFYKVAKKVVFSEHYMMSAIDTLKINRLSKNTDPTLWSKSDAYAESVATQIIAVLIKDNYIETRTMDRFTSIKEPGKWQETPPDYQQALEPHWSKIRPLVIDSSGIYSSKPLPSFSTSPSSPFYGLAKSVYDTSKKLTPEMEEIAWFWDDNPNTSDHRGHAVAIIHKISPPGHWLNIISQIGEKEKYDIYKMSTLYTYTAIAMFDGIISTWHEKYKSNFVRPITYINQHMDPDWKPLIQTPPFPEYTSGHSVISASAATVLTSMIGENYAFEDVTSTLYGAKPRSFTSFQDAAWEVSLSRYYGGIHFYTGIEEGNKQGKWIGDYILTKLDSKK
jgi:hypothetical protein